jgi:hypothetical protein
MYSSAPSELAYIVCLNHALPGMAKTDGSFGAQTNPH